MQTNEPGQAVGDLVEGWSTRTKPGGVTLAGVHVTAEPIGAQHSEALFAAVCGPGDEALWTYRPGPMPTSRQLFEDEVVRRLADHPDGATLAFVPAGGTASGFATFFPCVLTAGVVEISGVLLGRGLQRTTAATEAIHLMLRHAFDDLGYRRVEWKCDSLNAPSARAAARFGFTFEGRFRQHMVTNGRNRDTDWFSMLDGEWPEVRKRHEQWLSAANFDPHGRQVHRLQDLP